MVTNILHYLNENGQIPILSPEAKALLLFLAAVVEAVTLNDDKSLAIAKIDCRHANGDERCQGKVQASISDEDNTVNWTCSVCSDDGIISGWEGTQWDRRKLTIH